MDSHAIRLEQLLEHASWVRSLALRLVRDPGVADDVVQETWLVALRTPPEDDRNLRGWLARVVRNVVSNRHRTRARRATRETEVASRQEATPSTSELVEHVETQRRLAALVLELEEPLRATLLQRYYEGLSAAEIARRTDVPQGTVRWRLKRGIDELRGRLDASYGSRRSWCLALAPFATTSMDMGKTRPVDVVGKSGSVATSFLKGLLSMHFSFKLAAVGVLAFALTFLTPIGRWARSLPIAKAEPVRETPVFEPLSQAPPVEVPKPKNARQAVAAVEPNEQAPSTFVTAEILDMRGAPLQGALLRLMGPGNVQERTDSQGKVRLALPADWSFGPGIRARVRASGANYVAQDVFFDPVEGETVGLEVLRLMPAGAISGRVLDADGEPVAGAWVSAKAPSPASELDRERKRKTAFGVGDVRTDADGSFLLEQVPVGDRMAWAVLEGHEANASGWIEVRQGLVSTEIEVRLGVYDPGDYVEGIVLDPDGRPVTSGSVEARFSSWRGSGNQVASVRTDGRFRLYLEMQVPHAMRARDSAGRYTEARLEDVRSGARDVVLRLQHPVPIRVRAQGPDGEPLLGFFAGYESVFEGASSSRRLAAGEDGVVEFARPRGRFTVFATSEGYDRVSEGPFEGVSAPTELTLTLSPVPRVRGRVTFEGQGVPGARVTLRRLAQYEVLSSDLPSLYDADDIVDVATAADGRFAFTLREAGTFAVRAEADGYAPGELAPRTFVRHQELDGLDLELTRGGVIEGIVRGNDGAPSPGMVVFATRGDGYPLSQRVGADGRFRFQHLCPGPWRVGQHGVADFPRGSYRLNGWRPAFAPEDLRPNVDVVDGQTTRIELGSEARPVLRGRLSWSGRGAAGWKVQLLVVGQGTLQASREQQISSVDLEEDGSFELLFRDAGTHVLRLESPAAAIGGAGPVLTETLELLDGPNEWVRDLPVGGVVVENLLGPDAYGVVQEYLVGSVRGVDVLAPLQGEPGGQVSFSELPAGRLRLVRSKDPGWLLTGRTALDLPPVAEVRVVAGETARIRMPD